RVEPPPATAMLFCSGHSLMANGKVLHTGGNIAAEDLQCEQGGAPAGSTWAFEFDPLTPLDGDPWTQVADMANGRWYPTNTILPDGRMLVVSGFNACSFCDHGQPVTTVNSDIEIYTPGTPGAWSVVSQKEISLYPFLHVMQSGQVLLSGPGSLSEIFDPQTNQWTPVAQSQFAFRGSGTGVLLPGDADRVMIIGGDCCGQTATNTTEVLDLGGNPPQWQSGPSMVNARTHANAVLLPDGTVSVIGGRSDFGFGANPDPVYQAEILAPSTPWQEMASMCRPRMYHSTAVLLPDGRVLSAGGTAAGPQFPADERNAEIFYPPYLFKGPRPEILSVPTSSTYGEQFAVQTPSSSQIVAVTLVRPSSVTHSFNMDQRHVSLQFELGEVPESLLVDAPPNSNLAPPGYYMLFILSLGVDGQSLVPSVAEFIRLDLSSK
ncbi:MAG: DUF1929 domain-containing protein, partial [Planctomycetota bacterium]|nr:DUF1929 domain-containing protein [Planctomycetota bacterium]